MGHSVASEGSVQASIVTKLEQQLEQQAEKLAATQVEKSELDEARVRGVVLAEKLMNELTTCQEECEMLRHTVAALTESNQVQESKASQPPGSAGYVKRDNSWLTTELSVATSALADACRSTEDLWQQKKNVLNEMLLARQNECSQLTARATGAEAECF